jgi:4-amino-4-deoxy-L-arabinose transferase-like glycosyltransferase
MLEFQEKSHREKPWQITLIAAVFLAGLLIRLYDLTDLPMDFHPARQYHSAIIARGLYQQWGGVYPPEQAPLIGAQFVSEARIEPPLIEYLTAAVFALFKTDALWVARLYSILFWLTGGLPLYWLMKKRLGFLAALIGLGFYLLLPYGVYASRSFQPDPLMVSLSIFALWALERWQAQPGWKSAAAAGLLMGAAILVKQVMVFLLPAAMIALLWAGKGLRKSLRDPQAWLMVLLALLPAVLYNLWGVFVSGALAGQYTGRFFPQLWLDPGFYLRWLDMIADVFTLPVFFLALAGVLLLPRSPLKSMLAGYGIGYLLYGFVFAHHISTHDYYQLPVILLIAVGMGALLDNLWSALQKANPVRVARFAGAALLFGAALLCLWQTRSELKQTDYRAEGQLLANLAAGMGGNAAKTVGLTEDYGAALSYYGFILPLYWESAEDGVSLAAMDEAQFAQVFAERTGGRDYFIITDFDALAAQPLLEKTLDTHFVVFYEDVRYLIYALDDQPGS